MVAMEFWIKCLTTIRLFLPNRWKVRGCENVISDSHMEHLLDLQVLNVYYVLFCPVIYFLVFLQRNVTFCRRMSLRLFHQASALRTWWVALACLTASQFQIRSIGMNRILWDPKPFQTSSVKRIHLHQSVRIFAIHFFSYLLIYIFWYVFLIYF